ncbi:MAG TPA: uridine diphosphate-N-acetylglucosamine-binding protein YvcK [Acidobacteriaceae bacterium]|nr:uridine diphosphate-N-acetylglucosamine-binding protein YvcK [Acidobacteriaceae bacterium]
MQPPGVRVVAIGGGTGLSTLLRGLKQRVPHAAGLLAVPPKSPLIADLSAVVTVTDDGGSSGRLRRDFNMLPPGDLRNCMVALSEDEGLISQLFRHRFSRGEDLGGHNFGNLFIAALTEMTGDFGQAIKMAAEILATRGHIYPATQSDVTLAARMEDGSIVRGETQITGSRNRIVELMLEPPDPPPPPETLDAIAAADLITLGPGSLYTSIITNLLVHGIPQALGAARGTRVFICNLMTQANESLHLTASQHIERIYEHAGHPIFDYALVNTAPVSAAVRKRYAAEGAEVTVADVEKIEAIGIQVVTGNFAAEGDVLRHAADRVTDAVLALPMRAGAAVPAR